MLIKSGTLQLCKQTLQLYTLTGLRKWSQPYYMGQGAKPHTTKHAMRFVLG